MAFLNRRNLIYAFVGWVIHALGFAPNDFQKSLDTIAAYFFRRPKRNCFAEQHEEPAAISDPPSKVLLAGFFYLVVYTQPRVPDTEKKYGYQEEV
ncbi:MAG: hypothetical protein OEW73_03380 [Gammaproteobacteria bacterium]|nr:hypothetical protein [Gammaproteobacteria bacterium]MDH5239809.1 hypothetical protein [Gammaproteobacteria bacterium]MDH5261391.1 hypothetical protein [Gammaproteobacteria bacterium]MDH5582962.1 hypothetical protein [Gammaproteobacteria bacterium]